MPIENSIQTMLYAIWWISPNSFLFYERKVNKKPSTILENLFWWIINNIKNPFQTMLSDDSFYHFKKMCNATSEKIPSNSRFHVINEFIPNNYY